MNRKETTEFLSGLLIGDRLTGMGKYYAREVSLDYGTKDVRRVDFMQFEPAGVTSISGIEKGIFTCYEVKSCRADVFSGNGLNFVAEKNYIVTTMECYKDILPDIRSGKLGEHIRNCFLSSSIDFGIMVAVPCTSDIKEEFENPTPLDQNHEWQLKVIIPCIQGLRKKSMTELLFCMLRSGY